MELENEELVLRMIEDDMDAMEELMKRTQKDIFRLASDFRQLCRQRGHCAGDLCAGIYKKENDPGSPGVQVLSHPNDDPECLAVSEKDAAGTACRRKYGRMAKEHDGGRGKLDFGERQSGICGRDGRAK